MKTLIFTLLALLTITLRLSADDMAPREGNNPGHFYTRTTASTSEYWGSWVYWTGLETGVKVTNHVSLGVAFNSVLGNASSQQAAYRDRYYYYQTKAYAGAVVSYSGHASRRLHPVISMLVGEGWSGWESYPLVEDHDVRRERFGIIEPRLRLETDVTRVFSASAGASYMYTWGAGEWHHYDLTESFSLSLGLGLTMP